MNKDHQTSTNPAPSPRGTKGSFCSDETLNPISTRGQRPRANKGSSCLSSILAGPPLLLIWIYQKTLSPLLPLIFGPSCGCRFYPSCSHYAVEAIRTHGVLRGGFLAAIRLLKCTPLHPGGVDLVPPAKEKHQTHKAPCTCKHHHD